MVVGVSVGLEVGGGAVLLASRGFSESVFDALAGWRGDVALGALSLWFA